MREARSSAEKDQIMHQASGKPSFRYHVFDSLAEKEEATASLFMENKISELLFLSKKNMQLHTVSNNQAK